MILETVRDVLLEDVDTTSFVDERIYPDQLPDATTFPAIVLTKAGGAGNYDMEGDVNLEEARVQVDIYSADGMANLIEIRNAVRRRLSGYKGKLSSGSSCAIQGAFCINDSDRSDPVTERAGPRLRRRTLEFRIWNTEV